VRDKDLQNHLETKDRHGKTEARGIHRAREINRLRDIVTDKQRMNYQKLFFEYFMSVSDWLSQINYKYFAM
jgi:hypothetical protein